MLKAEGLCSDAASALRSLPAPASGEVDPCEPSGHVLQSNLWPLADAPTALVEYSLQYHLRRSSA